jgi:hypothetical protein
MSLCMWHFSSYTQDLDVALSIDYFCILLYMTAFALVVWLQFLVSEFSVLDCMVCLVGYRSFFDKDQYKIQQCLRHCNFRLLIGSCLCAHYSEPTPQLPSIAYDSYLVGILNKKCLCTKSVSLDLWLTITIFNFSQGAHDVWEHGLPSHVILQEDQGLRCYDSHSSLFEWRGCLASRV